jgi:hypothetical protein
MSANDGGRLDGWSRRRKSAAFGLRQARAIGCIEVY